VPGVISTYPGLPQSIRAKYILYRPTVMPLHKRAQCIDDSNRSGTPSPSTFRHFLLGCCRVPWISGTTNMEHTSTRDSSRPAETPGGCGALWRLLSWRILHPRHNRRHYSFHPFSLPRDTGNRGSRNYRTYIHRSHQNSHKVA